MRPLARVQAEALQRCGVEVLLVTSDQHPESDAARAYELVLNPRLRIPSTWSASVGAWGRIRRYQPDVVITELVRDPRWIAFAAGAPRVQLVHDGCAREPAEQRPGCERAVFDRWGAGCTATVTFSDYVASEVSGRRDVAGTRLHTIPLTSDLDESLVPRLAGSAFRRDFVMAGRLNPYKNLDVVLDAWTAHVSGPWWRGDDLVLLGAGSQVRRTLPKHTRWEQGNYRYRDIVGRLSAAKGSVAHYRRASQSGVQVLSMQLGVTPIVSTVGALPEYQPPGCPVIGVDDIAGLTAAFDELADPDTAARRGAVAAGHYARRFTADHAARRLLNILDDVTRGRPLSQSTALRAVHTSDRRQSQ